MSERKIIQVGIVVEVLDRAVKQYYDIYGEGLHHIKEWVDDPLTTIEEYRKKGISIIQSGEFDGSSFYYLDTEPYLGIILEIVKSGGTKHQKSDRRYPEE